MQEKKRYLYGGLTALIVLALVLLLCDSLFFRGVFPAFLQKFQDAVAPAVYGAALAYLLTPIVNAVERLIFRRKNTDPVFWVYRMVGIIAAWALLILAIYGLIRILLPELITSIGQLIANAENYYNEIYNFANRLLSDNPSLIRLFREQFQTYYSAVVKWLEESLIPQAQQILSSITGSVLGSILAILKFLYNFIIGFIVSISLLATKEHFTASFRKLTFSWFKESTAQLVLQGARRTNHIFSGFVRGKLLDSLIIGILCFIFSSLFQFPYALLVSVVVGVTNVIPFFGPFLGAVPSAFLILLVSPLKCLYFVIFIIVLQQFDGNILGPKILGDSTGLNPFWVVVAILVGGAFWGVGGMFLGVPTFACIYTAVQFFASRRLAKKGLPTQLEDYADGKPGSGETPPADNSSLPEDHRPADSSDQNEFPSECPSLISEEKAVHK